MRVANEERHGNSSRRRKPPCLEQLVLAREDRGHRIVGGGRPQRRRDPLRRLKIAERGLVPVDPVRMHHVVALQLGGPAAVAADTALMHITVDYHLCEGHGQCLMAAPELFEWRRLRPVRRAIGAATINPKLLTAAERLQYEGYLRREETNKSILALAADGVSIKGIVRQTRQIDSAHA